MSWPRQLDSGGGKPTSPADGPGTDRKSAPSATATWPPPRLWLFFLLILGLNFLVMQLLAPRAKAPITVPYTVFKQEVINGNVESIYSQGSNIEGRFVKAVTYPAPGAQDAAAPGVEPRAATNFKTVLPAFVDPGLEKLLIDHKVEISAKPIQPGGSLWTNLLANFGPALLIVALYVWLFRRAAKQGGSLGSAFMGFGKSQARRYDQAQDMKVAFDDVAGIDEAKNELAEIVDFLKEPGKYTRLGGTAPKGVLLVGAPGTAADEPAGSGADRLSRERSRHPWPRGTGESGRISAALQRSAVAHN